MHIRIYKFFPSRSSINLHINLLLLFVCLSNAELIMTWTSSRESKGLDRTSGVTLDLRMYIDVVSFSMIPYRVTS
jgi:hypothetical protein